MEYASTQALNMDVRFIPKSTTENALSFLRSPFGQRLKNKETFRVVTDVNHENEYPVHNAGGEGLNSNVNNVKALGLMVNVNAQALAFIYTQTGNAPAKPATLPRPPRPLTTSRYHTSRRPFRPSVPRYSRECWCDCCTGSNCRPSRQRIIYFTLAPYCTQNACSQSC
ncbi:unnamed protein product, partial [Rotaria sp. Silwood1]